MPLPPRKRKRPDLKKWLWSLCAANTACGLYLSPVTSLTTVRVTGAMPNEKEAIARALQAGRDLSYLRYKDEGAMSEIQALQGIERASIERNLFGRGVLKLKRFKAVAVVDHGGGMALSDSGRWCRLEKLDPDWPQLVIARSQLEPSPCLVSKVSSQQLAHLVQGLTKAVPDWNGKLELADTGVLTATEVGVSHVILGSDDDLDAKLEALSNLYQQRPELFDKPGSEVNLTYPKVPTIRPLAGGVKQP